MGYPTPDQWRSYAASAQALSDKCRADGEIEAADRHHNRAEFYLDKAHDEEWRLSCKLKALEGIAA